MALGEKEMIETFLVWFFGKELLAGLIIGTGTVAVLSLFLSFGFYAEEDRWPWQKKK